MTKGLGSEAMTEENPYSSTTKGNPALRQMTSQAEATVLCLSVVTRW